MDRPELRATVPGFLHLYTESWQPLSDSGNSVILVIHVIEWRVDLVEGRVFQDIDAAAVAVHELHEGPKPRQVCPCPPWPRHCAAASPPAGSTNSGDLPMPAPARPPGAAGQQVARGGSAPCVAALPGHAAHWLRGQPSIKRRSWFRRHRRICAEAEGQRRPALSVCTCKVADLRSDASHVPPAGLRR